MSLSKKYGSVKEGYLIKKQRVGFTIWQRINGSPELVLLGGVTTEPEAEQWCMRAYREDTKRVGYFCPLED